jgi:hypothetical protein
MRQCQIFKRRSGLFRYAPCFCRRKVVQSRESSDLPMFLQKFESLGRSPLAVLLALILLTTILNPAANL